MPYTSDLVRLAASAVLAAEHGVFKAKAAAIAEAILEGYDARLATAGKAFVLEEHNGALRAIAYREENDPKSWWAKLEKELFAMRPPAEARTLLAYDWPDGAVGEVRLHYRSAGLGSLGRPRYVALAHWHGSKLAREVKALVPSAVIWAERAGAGSREAISYAEEALGKSVRCRDPFLRIKENWVIRRLAPRASKIEIAGLDKRRDPLRLLEAMGGETANVHAGTARALGAVRRDLDRRRHGWLAGAAQDMADTMRAEWKAWKKATSD